MDVPITLDLKSSIGSSPMLLLHLRYVANPHSHIHARLPPHTRQRSLIAHKCREGKRRAALAAMAILNPSVCLF